MTSFVMEVPLAVLLGGLVLILLLAAAIVRWLTAVRRQAAETAEVRLAEKTAILEITLENMDQGIALFDRDLNLVAFNKRCVDLLNLPPGRLRRGAAFADLVHDYAARGEYGPGDVDALVRQRLALARRPEPLRFERTRPDGTVIEVRRNPVASGGFVTTYTDVSDRMAADKARERAEEELRRLANHDALTGLPSLRLGTDRLARALAGARRHDIMAALMFVDLDGFKSVNDTMGHEAGDRVLKVVAGRLLAAVRETDTVARYGGDEFIIVLTDVGNRDAAARVAEKVIESVARSISHDGNLVSVGASVGIALYPDHGESPGELLKRADEAMYAVKRHGKNGFRFAEYPPESVGRVGHS